MPTTADPRDELGGILDRLTQADAMTAALWSEVARSCRRVMALGGRASGAKLTAYAGAGAWVDAALALVEIELPGWAIRRAVRDDGEWHCALSRQRSVPEWLDQTIETHHHDLALALIKAVIEAMSDRAWITRPEQPEPLSARSDHLRYFCCDNF